MYSVCSVVYFLFPIKSIYLPLYIFCGDELLCARLRTADKGATDGALDELQRIIADIRKRWPQTEIVIRGDSGFCDAATMTWCEAQQNVHYLFGLAQNARLLPSITRQQERARLHCARHARKRRACLRNSSTRR